MSRVYKQPRPISVSLCQSNPWHAQCTELNQTRYQPVLYKRAHVCVYVYDGGFDVVGEYLCSCVYVGVCNVPVSVYKAQELTTLIILSKIWVLRYVVCWSAAQIQTCNQRDQIWLTNWFPIRYQFDTNSLPTLPFTT